MSEPAPTSEFGLIDWIRRRAQPRVGSWTKLGIGDDCAILSVGRDSEVLAMTDMLMDGRHFHLAEDGAEAVGYKALAVNLSDIAAMAGVPHAALVAVASGTSIVANSPFFRRNPWNGPPTTVM